MAAPTSKQLAQLRGLAHDKKPVILLGNKGLTEAVIKETASALLTHELIKVRLADGELDEVADALRKATGAVLVGRIGKMAILYKRHPEKPRIVLER